MKNIGKLGLTISNKVIQTVYGQKQQTFGIIYEKNNHYFFKRVQINLGMDYPEGS
jgi:hypothetical protein